MDQSRVLAGIFVVKLLPNPDKNSHLNLCNGSIIFFSRTLIREG
jgi:hypothetical protein